MEYSVICINGISSCTHYFMSPFTYKITTILGILIFCLCVLFVFLYNVNECVDVAVDPINIVRIRGYPFSCNDEPNYIMYFRLLRNRNKTHSWLNWITDRIFDTSRFNNCWYQMQYSLMNVRENVMILKYTYLLGSVFEHRR